MHPQDPAAAEVRGIVFIGIREYIQSKLALGEMDLFIKPLPFEVSYALINAEKGEWYPYSIQVKLHESIANRFDRNHPEKAIYDLGLYLAEFEINAVLRAMFGVFPIKLVASRVQTIWSKFYRKGKATARLVHDKKAVLELREFPTDRLFCSLVEAWMEVAARYLKLKELSVKQTVAIHKGTSLSCWEIEWE
ncbi:hypothetical protein JXM67_08275 [candidate division WOR-3 bacterium]|nr:hypothetical protein [candidate division WOR-3 bacterium]